MDALLRGTGSPQVFQPDQAGSGVLLGEWMGALLGGTSGSAPSQSGPSSGSIDFNTLLTAGMAFFQAQQQGASTMEALISAILPRSKPDNPVI